MNTFRNIRPTLFNKQNEIATYTNNDIIACLNLFLRYVKTRSGRVTIDDSFTGIPKVCNLQNILDSILDEPIADKFIESMK